MGGIRDQAIGLSGVIHGTARASCRQAGAVEAPYPPGKNGLLAVPDAGAGITVFCCVQIFAHVGRAAGFQGLPAVQRLLGKPLGGSEAF
ncbi:hypothetical protein D3C76_1573570 [compost metagenome]